MKALATGRLRADPTDPGLVWLDSDGRRVDLVWPAGFGVAFDHQPPELVAAGGQVVASVDGSHVSLGGGFSENGRTFYVCEVNGRDWSGL